MTGRWWRMAPLTAAALLAGSLSRADSIELNNGGEVRGEIRGNVSSSGAEPITIETLGGAVVTVERDQIKNIIKRSLKLEEYYTRARALPEDAEAHWQLAEWCREQRLSRQRTEQLERVVALDPDHEPARLALGHEQRDGVWMTRDEAMAADGYVKHGSRYVTPQEKELLEQAEADEEDQREWYVRIRQLHSTLSSGSPQRQQEALMELRAIHDPNAVSSLRRLFQQDENKAMRRLYVAVLSQIPGEASAVALAQQAIFDADAEVRYEALGGLSPSQA
ncbi:MAG: HEAT repeat domain-containing protein, partial [Planctomycetaceae bacterium]